MLYIKDVRIQCSDAFCIMNTTFFVLTIILTVGMIFKLRLAFGINNLIMISCLVVILAVRGWDLIDYNFLAKSKGKNTCDEKIVFTDDQSKNLEMIYQILSVDMIQDFANATFKTIDYIFVFRMKVFWDFINYKINRDVFENIHLLNREE